MKEFSDVTLVLQSDGTVHKEIYATKVILAANSMFFYSLFTVGMKEKEGKSVVIDISVDDAPLLYALIKSLYTGVLSVDTDSEELSKMHTYVNLLRVADMYGIRTRYIDCVGLFKKIRRTISCICHQFRYISFYQLKHNLEVKSYLLHLKELIFHEFKKFDKAWQTEDFLELPKGLLKSLLQRDELEVTSEATVLQALKKWFGYDPAERVDDTVALIGCVRFTQIAPSYLTWVVLSVSDFFSVDLTDIEESKGKNLKDTLRKSATESLESAPPKQPKRSSYISEETSEIIEFAYSLYKPNSVSRNFFFRGIYFYITIEAESPNLMNCLLHHALKDTNGDLDPKSALPFQYHFTVQVRNQNVLEYDQIFSRTLEGIPCNGTGGNIHEKLFQNNNHNPAYFGPLEMATRKPSIKVQDWKKN
eukprot:TRINITY_DN794_c0_g2_i3.p1 TRINITY_DN794_c0_g2~~TRINITY_DN794_c0_g2_i3.p1  ORF type:complete len:419 (+),score=47.95 TRINITY_DN794_c0_g2_i3:868-2124(+)